ncbi:hypothetical protein HPB48_001153 [Haemaphysalis longicornis]|uniref:PPIase cyclophilin-type domain-containing protein n=1 Tax=Haemaphysalis longicornis TaxID=44386 RepID=A0A9J6F947_HAELO|nr:hypothetical protein HPB48_001153 [Haemaphysalis longicornis]
MGNTKFVYNGVANGNPLVYIVMPLSVDVMPRALENCQQPRLGGKALGHKYSPFHSVIPKFTFDSEDFKTQSETRGKSKHGNSLEDKQLKRTCPSTLSTVSARPNQNLLAFFQTLSKATCFGSAAEAKYVVVEVVANVMPKTAEKGSKFPDQKFQSKTTDPGTLSMANARPNPNLSLFFLPSSKACCLDGKDVAFVSLAYAGKLIVAYVVPRTTENCRALCTGQKAFACKGSAFYRVILNFMSRSGSYTACGGTGGKSKNSIKFENEDIQLTHTNPGVLSMASVQRHKNLFQFFLTVDKTSYLEGKRVTLKSIAETVAAVKKAVVHAVPVAAENFQVLYNFEKESGY